MGVTMSRWLHAGVLVLAAAALVRVGNVVPAPAPGANGVSFFSAERQDTAVSTLAIKGMACGSCATTARIALERSEGVFRAVVSYDSANATVWFDPARTAPARFIEQLKRMTGYEATLVRQTASWPDTARAAVWPLATASASSP